jgi:hypothetical protein
MFDTLTVIVLDLVSQLCDIVLMSVYRIWQTPGGRDLDEGVYEQGEGNGEFSV